MNQEYLNLDAKGPVGRHQELKPGVQIDNEPAQFSDLYDAADGDKAALTIAHNDIVNLRYLHKIIKED